MKFKNKSVSFWLKIQPPKSLTKAPFYSFLGSAKDTISKKKNIKTKNVIQINGIYKITIGKKLGFCKTHNWEIQA